MREHANKATTRRIIRAAIHYLAEYVATFETLFNAQVISPVVVQAMCFGERLHARAS